MRATDKVALLRRVAERSLPRHDGFLGIDVVIDGDGRIPELHLGGMHDVAPEQQALAAALNHVAGVSWRMPILGNAPDAREQHGCAVEGPQLPRADRPI